MRLVRTRAYNNHVSRGVVFRDTITLDVNSSRNSARPPIFRSAVGEEGVEQAPLENEAPRVPLSGAPRIRGSERRIFFPASNVTADGHEVYTHE